MMQERSDKNHMGKTGAVLSLKLVLYQLPLLMIFISLFAGRYSIAPGETIKALGALFGGDCDVSNEIYTLVVNVRLPRALAAAAVGAGLAASGAAFQGVFRNPLVSSNLLGVSSGAGFGAALAIVTGAGMAGTYPLAFVFGLGAVFISYSIARVYKSTPTIMLILGGIITSSVFSSLISLMKYIADPETQLPGIVFWLMGSLASVGWESFFAVIPIAIGCILLVLMAWRINVLSMGDKEARTLGVNVGRDKLLVIGGAALATAGAVCMSGMIGWVGLVIPHISRMITGNDNRRLIPMAIAVGASFMSLIDLVSRTVTAQEIPLGILTSLIGAPFFVYLLKKTKGGGW